MGIALVGGGILLFILFFNVLSKKKDEFEQEHKDTNKEYKFDVEEDKDHALEMFDSEEKEIEELSEDRAIVLENQLITGAENEIASVAKVEQAAAEGRLDPAKAIEYSNKALADAGKKMRIAKKLSKRERRRVRRQESLTSKERKQEELARKSEIKQVKIEVNENKIERAQEREESKTHNNQEMNLTKQEEQITAGIENLEKLEEGIETSKEALESTELKQEKAEEAALTKKDNMLNSIDKNIKNIAKVVSREKKEHNRNAFRIDSNTVSKDVIDVAALVRKVGLTEAQQILNHRRETQEENAVDAMESRELAIERQKRELEEKKIQIEERIAGWEREQKVFGELAQDAKKMYGIDNKDYKRHQEALSKANVMLKSNQDALNAVMSRLKNLH